MSAVAFKFLSLPPKAQRNVLRAMKLLQLFNFSFVSENVRRLVKSLDFQPLLLNVTYFREPKLEIKSTVLYMYTEFIITFGKNGTMSHFPIEISHNFHFRDCIDRILDVFNIRKINLFQIAGTIENPHDFLQLFGNLCCKTLVICFNFRANGTSISVHREILKYLGSCCEEINIFNLSIDISIHEVLSRDLNYIFLQPDQPITVDNLLSLNSRKFQSSEPSKLSSEDVNLFLKHWIRGSDPYLEFVELPLLQSASVKKILKNIPYKLPGRNQGREVLGLNGIINKWGGFDIQREDGAKAVVDVENTGSYSTFKFYCSP